MATFRKAEASVCKMVVQCAQKYHPTLVSVGVTVETLMAHGQVNKDGEITGPALKKNGVRAEAMIRRTSHKDRVAGLSDAILYLDGDTWGGHSEPRQIALIDHELTHLELVEDGDGGYVLDDCFRPKLKLKPHDAEIGVFFSVMQKHGSEALDTALCAQLAQDTREYIQPLLTWG